MASDSFNRHVLDYMLEKGYIIDKDGEIKAGKEPPKKEGYVHRIWENIRALTA